MPQRHSDDLFQFSYRLFKIEYVVVKLVFFALSLYGLYQFATRELGMNSSPPTTSAKPATTNRNAVSPPAFP